MNDHRLFIVHKNNNIRLETSQTNFSFPVINLMIQRRYYLYEYLVLYMPMLIWDKIIGNIFIWIHILTVKITAADNTRTNLLHIVSRSLKFKLATDYY